MVHNLWLMVLQYGLRSMNHTLMDLDRGFMVNGFHLSVDSRFVTVLSLRKPV